MKKNIGYLILREDLNSPIIYTQVLKMLSKIDLDRFNVNIIWLYRIDYLFKNKKSFNSFKNKAKKYGINVIKFPIFLWKFPQPHFFRKFIEFQGKFILNKIIKKHEIDILHGRGYYAGLILRLVKKRDKSLITIFDPRSPYIKEMISTYNKKEKSSYIKKWKELEKSIINENDYTISVSESLKLYYKNILKNYIKRNIITIPNCVNLIPKDHIKKIINLNRRNSICYVGSIGNGWNNLDFYIENIKIINNYFPNIKFEFYVIEKNPGELREKLIKNGISKDIFIIDTVDPAEIPYKIAGCLAGLQLMKNKDERMGIKVVDYLGAGIPIITNTLAMGSTEIVTKFEVGIVEEMTIGNKSRLYLSKIINNKNERIYYEEKCLNISYKNFSIESIAKKYNKIYKRWKY